MYASRRVTRRMAGKKRERSVRTAMMGFNDGLRGAVVAERIAKYLDLFCVYGYARGWSVYTRKTSDDC